MAKCERELRRPHSDYWVHKHNANVTIFHRREGTFEVIRVEATLNCSIFNMLAVANEVCVWGFGSE